MNTIEYIKMALENSTGWAMGLINDMKDAALTQPTPNGGNHPLWVLGHIVFAESLLLDCFIQGKENRFPELVEKFDVGSTPTTNPDDYPSFDELLGKFESIRAASMEYLNGLSEADLDTKSHAPEGYEATFGTVGRVYAAMCTHIAFHAGQVADARRAAGRAVLIL